MKKRKCAVCGDTCQTNVQLRWKRDRDKKIFYVCLACAESQKVNENSVQELISKTYTTVCENARKYKVINYFDVWGNAKDGYDVNDVYIAGFLIVNDGEDVFREFMKSSLFMNSGKNLLPKECVADYAGESRIEINLKKDGMPLFGLEEVEMK